MILKGVEQINSLFLYQYIYNKITMKDTFRLYINNQLVDFEQEPKFEFKYQQEDLSNPTIIKNSFSKTIKIEGTDNNNRIFGEIYNLDREQIYKYDSKSCAYFNPSKRTPFELYKNSELIESGYMQLTDISVSNKRIIYNISLFGGLGDFFYSLQFKGDGERKTLADLVYKITDDNGNILPQDTELNFNINKDFVHNSWERLNSGVVGNTISDFITFAPAYNGLYDNFDNNKFLINTNGTQIFVGNNSVTEEDITYTTYNGYKLAETEREFTELEVKDLRSYMQRPCIRFSKLFNAICDADNNGGYSVKLDKTFFNTRNPYYSKTYMALPLLPTISTDSEDKTYKIDVDRNVYSSQLFLGNFNGNTTTSTNYRYGFDGTDLNALEQNNFVINTSTTPVSSTFGVEIEFDLNFYANSLWEYQDNSNLYLSFYEIIKSKAWYKSIVVQLVAYNPNTPDVKYKSEALNFTNALRFNNTLISTPDKWGNNPNDTNTYKNMLGKFVRQSSNGNVYKWVLDDDNSTKFKLSFNNIPHLNQMVIELDVKIMKSPDLVSELPLLVNKQSLLATDMNATPEYQVDGYCFMPYYADSCLFNYYPNEHIINSGSLITKQRLLQTEFSPCDVLLDYCKMFGLYFTKDIHSKTINILTKNNFYSGNVVNIDNRIDYSNDMIIKPYLFETKYYLMKSPETDTYYSKKYKSDYNIEYGQKRIDTNYNFNMETKNIYDKSVFQNAITALDTSPYYRTYFNVLRSQAPCWLLDNPTVMLYNGVGTNDVKTYESTYNYSKYINLNYTQDWNGNSGYDMFPKTVFYNLDNNNKSLSDISATLLFFNGFKNLTTADNTLVPFWVTDDLVEMNKLNDGTMCYLHTEVENDMYGNKIAIKRNTLPQFTRYYSSFNWVSNSLDFGLPKEIYIPNFNYNETATLYNKFWGNYLSDRYNVNTKKVSCYVNLEGMKVNQDMLKDFYYFNNCIWVINKIENYLPNSYNTTKVEFIKVNDTDNYINAQSTFGSMGVVLSENECLLQWDETKYGVELESEFSWRWATPLGGSMSVSPSSGSAGKQYITLTTNINNEEDIRTNIYSFIDANNNITTFALKQIPSPLNAKKVYGYVYDYETLLPLQNYTLKFMDGISGNNTVEKSVKTDENGYYELYLGKSITYNNQTYIEVYNPDNILVRNRIVWWSALPAKVEMNYFID